jgi:TM2 domain-containing membrane protein YozV
VTRTSSNERTVAVTRAAYRILALAGIAFCLIAVVTLYLVDWVGISASLGLNLGIVVLGGALAWFANLALFGAIPTVSAALSTSLTGWFGLVQFIVLGAALALMVFASARTTVSRPSPPDPVATKKHASTAWALLVAGGLVGAHNFYLRRAWAGVMNIGLLLVTTVTWSSLLFSFLAATMGALLIWDGFKIGVRIQELNRAIAVRPTRRNFQADSAHLKGTGV